MTPETTRPSPAYHRVLIPLDGSLLAEAALPFVRPLARPLGLEIALLRVVPNTIPHVVEGTRQVVADPSQQIAAEAEEYLCGVAERLTAEGFRVTTAVRTGEAAGEILAGARECGADLIGMTTHGRTGLGRLFFGSVAEAVLRRSEVPVFIVRATEDQTAHRAA
jgi:nucleotide-binding universal stress UspA family protein